MIWGRRGFMRVVCRVELDKRRFYLIRMDGRFGYFVRNIGTGMNCPKSHSPRQYITLNSM